MDKETARIHLREMLIKAKFYRAASVIFALCGIGVFVFLMSRFVDGDIYVVLKDPTIIIILLIPFLPAAVLSWLAVRSEKKFAAMLESLDKPS